MPSSATDLPYRLDPTWSVDTASLGGSVPDASIADTGDVYVLSRDPGMVHVIDGRTAEPIRTFGDEHLSRGPHGITVVGDRVYVVDQPDHAVRVFSLEGDLVNVVGTPGEASDSGADATAPLNDQWQTVQRAAGPFNQPAKATVDARGRVFIADGYANSRVHAFDEHGELLHSWGEPGSGPSGFSNVHGVLALSDGTIAVANRQGRRVQYFDPSGAFIRSVATEGRPAALAEDAPGRLVVAELAHPETGVAAGLSVITQDGTIVARGTAFDGGAPLRVPHGLAGRAGTLIVVDLELRTITRGTAL